MEFDRIGKTGMMKIMYLLQQVYKVPLEYNFSIYTYGPFDDSVLAYINATERDGLVDINRNPSSGGVSSYEISATPNFTNMLSEPYTPAIHELKKIFTGYNARKWELSSTIVFVYVVHARCQPYVKSDDVCDRVHKLKPHFLESDILNEFNYLNDHNILSKATQL
jgi:hypothetical protein